MAATPTRHHLVNVADLRRRLGERRVVDIDIVLPPLSVVATSNTDDPVTGSVVFDSIERGVSVTGTIEFSWEGECRRCLEPVRDRSLVDLMEIFQVGAPREGEEGSDEINELIDDTVDLVPLVRDIVLLSLPLAPLCSDDCAGPDPDRFPAATEASVEAERAAAGPRPDPRWAALEGLHLEE